MLLSRFRESVTPFIFKRKTMIKEGTEVKWNWGNGTATGTVQSTFTKKVTRTIDGNEVTRDGEEGNKALYIKQDDGASVLKLESEVERAD